MSWNPSFKLYNSVGDTLLYTFPVVIYTNLPHGQNKNSVVIEGTRGKGCIIIDGGDSSWDLIIRGVITGDNYQEIVTAMDALNTAVAMNTAYKLRVDKSPSTYYEYNVKRIQRINYPESLRTSHQIYEITLKSNSWG